MTRYGIHLENILKKDQILKKDPSPWTLEHTNAMRKIKYKVKMLPILYLAYEDLPKILESDANNNGWGGILKKTK